MGSRTCNSSTVLGVEIGVNLLVRSWMPEVPARVGTYIPRQTGRTARDHTFVSQTLQTKHVNGYIGIWKS